MKGKMSKRRHPLMNGHATLDFEIEINPKALTEDQKTERFISQYQERVDPVVTYSEYFETSVKTIAHIFKEVKRFYKDLVLTGKWSEEKYVHSLDSIFTNRAVLSVYSLDYAGRGYDQKQAKPRRK